MRSPRSLDERPESEKQHVSPVESVQQTYRSRRGSGDESGPESEPLVSVPRWDTRLEHLHFSVLNKVDFESRNKKPPRMADRALTGSI